MLRVGNLLSKQVYVHILQVYQRELLRLGEDGIELGTKGKEFQYFNCGNLEDGNNEELEEDDEEDIKQGGKHISKKGDNLGGPNF